MSREPRIYIYDVETSQNIAKSWGPKYNTNLNSVLHMSHLLSFAGKWLGEDEIEMYSLRSFKRSYKRNRRDDRQLAEVLADRFKQADLVVAHNGDKFDMKVLNGRMIVNDLPRVGPVASVDTVKVARAEFRFPSYALNDLARYFELGAKVQHTGLHLWDDVDEGKPEAWDMMEEYNIGDVELEEKLYLKLRDGGWIKQHPNLALITAKPDACPVCGEEHTLQVRGYHRALTQTYPKFRCSACGSYSRGTKAVNDPSAPKPHTRPI